MDEEGINKITNPETLETIDDTEAAQGDPQKKRCTTLEGFFTALNKATDDA